MHIITCFFSFSKEEARIRLVEPLQCLFCIVWKFTITGSVQDKVFIGESRRESLWFPLFLASCEVCCCFNCELVFKLCLCFVKVSTDENRSSGLRDGGSMIKELLSELQEFHFLAVCCAFVLTASCFVLVWDETLHLGPQSVNDIMWVARRWSNLNLTLCLFGWSSQMKVSLSLRQVKWWRFPSVCSFFAAACHF